jgi:4-hydroxy-3-methylbut-2-en-1-yl diphosphate reductase
MERIQKSPVTPVKALHFSDELSNGPENQTIEITIAPNAGACFGVVRAIKLGRMAAQKGQGESTNVYSLGPLIHNPKVVEELGNLGVVTVPDAKAISGGTVLLRSHGVQKEIEQELREKGATIVDATCPLVKKPQRIASGLAAKGYFLVMVGDSGHPEVKGVISYFGSERYLITYDPDDVAKIPLTEQKIGVLAQTTIEVSVLNEVVKRVRERFSDVAVYNTICEATSVRQSEAIQLASAAEVLVVVGGKNSSNTNKLVKICKGLQKDTYHIESLSEIKRSWFDGKRRIGVTAGASTPHEFVDEVGNYIAQLLHD